MRETSPDPFVAGRRAQRFGVVLAGATLLSGCFSDVPPDPEVQPLEIIAGNPDPEYGPCLLNVDKVGAGTHEVTPIIVEGRATVRIRNPSGKVIFKRTLDEPHATIPPEWQGPVRLAPGNHSVECSFPDATHTTTLLVVPARPEYKEGSTG